MTPNNEDDIHLDDTVDTGPAAPGGGDDFDFADDLEGGGKSSLAEMWQNNPLLKVAAVVVGGAIAVGGYMMVTAPDPGAETISVVRGVDSTGLKQTPGQEQLDSVYADAVREGNVQRAEEAMASGTSSVPTPVASSKDQGLDIPELGNTISGDPLQEWKDRIALRDTQRSGSDEEDILGPQPDLVPLVQPIRPRPQIKVEPESIAKMSEQMRTIIAAQVPPKPISVGITSRPSLYTLMITEQEQQAALASQAPAFGGGGGASSFDSGGQYGGGGSEERTIVPAGQIAYAQLLTELNSDVPGPALAAVLSGPFRGGRAMGQMQAEKEHIVITFDRIIKDDVTYSISGIALNENTTLPAHQTDIDYHYFSRIVLPAAAKFVEGYSSALAETGTTTTTTAGGGVATEEETPDAKESIYSGVEEAAGFIGAELTARAPEGPTIRVARGATMGILFLDSVKTTGVQ